MIKPCWLFTDNTWSSHRLLTTYYGTPFCRYVHVQQPAEELWSMQIEKVSETVMASSNQEAAALEQRLPDADIYVCKINVHIYMES